MMENASAALDQAIEPRQRLIIALDVPTAAVASGLVEELRDHVGAFKVGMQLFTAAGPEFVRELTAAGDKVFLDLKFHDIPNTVASAAVEAARLGVWMLNVHAVGGREMMERTREAVDEACKKEHLTPPKLIAVTVLTSSDRTTLAETGIEREVEAQVAALAQLAESSGLDGVVASPLEVELIRKTIGNNDFLIVTPGIRPISATNDDQRRVMTFAGAVVAGSDYVVVGRPIIRAYDRIAAVEQMLNGN